MRTLPWRRLGWYLLATSLMGILLGVLGKMGNWSEGTALVATTVLGAPISFAAVLDTIAYLRDPEGTGRRTRRRPGA